MDSTIKKTAALIIATPLALGVACGTKDSTLTDKPDPTSTTTAAGGQGGTTMAPGGFNPGDGGSGGSGSGPCNPTEAEDFDGDGYSINDGDCNDCDENVNPNAVEVIAGPKKTPIDENCNDLIDEPFEPCDKDLAIDDADPLSAAKAAELCKQSTGPKDWGVVSATWVMADGLPPPQEALVNFHLGHGLLTHLGANIALRKGERMLALSSGTARNPDEPGYQPVSGFPKGYQCSHPAGFPIESSTCMGVVTGTPNDPTGVQIEVRTPSNAHGISFDFYFLTYEWPHYICSQYNDFFVALLTPPPPNQLTANISFDSQGNPVSVNNAFLEVCGCMGNPPNPCIAGMKSFTCALGNVDLIGTGFGFDYDQGGEDHAATGWLNTKAPIEPASTMSLRWAVYDSGDGVLDSTTLIDNFRWIAEAGTPTKTTPIPK